MSANHGQPVTTKSDQALASGGQESGQTGAATGNKPTLEEELAALNIRVTCLDSLRKMVYSKTEWEAYLLQRIEKEKRS